MWSYCQPSDVDAFDGIGKVVKIVLTVAHVDQDVTNNEPWNLLALCQRCHLKIDLPWKMKKRQNAALVKKLEKGVIHVYTPTISVIERKDK